MESTTNSNNHEDITRTIISQPNINSAQLNLNLDMVLQVIGKIGEITGCKLYNQDQLTNQLVELDEENFVEQAKKTICENLIPQVEFNTLFKSNLGFTLVFNQDDVIVLYKNKPVTVENLNSIKSNFVENNKEILPCVSEMYVNNVCQVVEKFITKDISVQYYCTNIPQPYWKLFEIKCKKANTITQSIKSQCQELDKIITGEKFKVRQSNNVQVLNQESTVDDPELRAALMQIEEFENKNKSINSNNASLSDNEKKALDDVYRMEVMSYLNDNDIMQFLDVLEKIDGFDKEAKYSEQEFITKYFKFVLESTSLMGNKIAKFYYVYKLYCLINDAPWFIEKHDGMRANVANKINEFTEELYILQSAELKLYHGIVNTMNKTKNLIDSIGKKSNPNYVATWQTNNQESILNQIINANGTNANNKNMIVLDSDDEMEQEDNYHSDSDYSETD